MTVTIEPDVSKWAPWRPEEVAGVLADVEAPWYVAGGWAIELFADGYRRGHEDLEIAVPNDRFDEIVAALDGHEVFVITGPSQATPLRHARHLLGTTHQTWIREPTTELWRVDVFREPSEGEAWVCRRNATIRLPYGRLIEWTADGIPYGRPEVIVLFKAKHAKPKDDADLAAVLPLLTRDRREWLARALALVHPGHRWIPEVAPR